VYSNKSGFTLIEFLVAIVILMVGLLGLLQAVNVAMNTNLTNQFRNEAVMYGDEVMAMETTKPFNAISTSGSTAVRSDVALRNVNLAMKMFSSQRINQTVSNNTTNVQVRISWTHKGVKYTHNISSLVSSLMP
jgi:type IV pilus assembly protein PilV